MIEAAPQYGAPRLLLYTENVENLLIMCGQSTREHFETFVVLYCVHARRKKNISNNLSWWRA
jgi:hypothetical protein